MRTKPRSAPIDIIVWHDPEGANTARELYGYLQGIDAGYHVMMDNNELIVAASDDLQVQGAGGVNSRSLNICIVPGRAAWTRDTWMQYQPAMRLGAAKCAEWCHLYGIPPVRLTPEQVRDGVKGICTHGDVSVYHPESEGHTDPGPNFPLDDIVIPMIGGVAPTPVEEEIEDMIIEAPASQQTDPNAPACVTLDIPNKKFNLLGGAKVAQASTSIPAPGEIRGWYEIYSKLGRKRGFKVIGARDPKSGKNQAYTYTWK